MASATHSLRQLHHLYFLLHHISTKTSFAVRIMNNLGVLFTFGFLAPPLGIILTLSILLDMYLYRLSFHHLMNLQYVIPVHWQLHWYNLKDMESIDRLYKELQTKHFLEWRKIDFHYIHFFHRIMIVLFIVCDTIWGFAVSGGVQ
jgi:hypothetical protein